MTQEEVENRLGGLVKFLGQDLGSDRCNSARFEVPFRSLIWYDEGGIIEMGPTKSVSKLRKYLENKGYEVDIQSNLGVDGVLDEKGFSFETSSYVFSIKRS